VADRGVLDSGHCAGGVYLLEIWMNQDEFDQHLTKMSQDIQQLLSEGFATWPVDEMIPGYFSLLIGLAVFKAAELGVDKAHFLENVARTWDYNTENNIPETYQ
jgi:hypothetical protein